jgi:hypothetical protein
VPFVGAEPTLVDATDFGAGDLPPPLPLLALTDERLIWATVHHTPDGLRYQLLSYSISAGQTEILEAADPDQRVFWFPFADRDGHRLVYSAVDVVGGREEFHVYLRDLARDGEARRLDAFGDATMPVLSGDVVVWKHVADQNVYNSSWLERGSIGDQSTGFVTTTQVRFDRQPLVNYPSVGDRYLAVWGNDDTDFELFDLLTGGPVVLGRRPPTSLEGWVRPDVAGDLLTFVRVWADGSQPIELYWAMLPPA